MSFSKNNPRHQFDDAVYRNNVKIAKNILDEYPHLQKELLNRIGPDGWTPIAYAVQNDCVEMIKLFHSYDSAIVDKFLLPSDGAPRPIALALTGRNLKSAITLFDLGANSPEMNNPLSWNPFHKNHSPLDSILNEHALRCINVHYSKDAAKLVVELIIRLRTTPVSDVVLLDLLKCASEIALVYKLIQNSVITNDLKNNIILDISNGNIKQNIGELYLLSEEDFKKSPEAIALCGIYPEITRSHEEKISENVFSLSDAQHVTLFRPLLNQAKNPSARSGHIHSANNGTAMIYRTPLLPGSR